MEEQKDFQSKKTKSKLAENIQITLPLIEEITNEKVLPLCLIGFSVKEDGQIQARFATVSNDEGTKSALLEICKQLIESESENSTTMNKEQVITDEDKVRNLIKTVFMEAQKGGGYTKETENHFLHLFYKQQDEWEVVELMTTNNTILLWENYEMGWGNDNNGWVQNNLPYKCTINKVRRLSDSAVLEIGKEYEIEFRSGTKVTDKILSINYIEKELVYYYNKGSALIKDMISMVECKPVVLFITTDGKEIRAGDKYYYIDKYRTNNSIVYSLIAQEGCGTTDDFLYFSSKEKAEKHIPNLSLEMIREALDKVYGASGELIIENIMENMEAGLAKLKTNSYE